MKPNEMPKRYDKQRLLRMQLLAGLIETRKSTWTQKVITKDEDGKEQVESVNHRHDPLRYPLAANIAEWNVERLSREWL